MNTALKSGKKTTTIYPATLVSSKRLFPEDKETREEVRELVIEVGDSSFTCEAGQSIGILAPTPKGAIDQWHLRWYSVADIPAGNDKGNPRFTIFVRRMVLKDPETGLICRGHASNYLCDLAPGESIKITGPQGIPFEVPPEKDATLILIGTGTGIAPFRAFIKHIYRNVPDWKGIVRLFYGTRNGLDILYTNDPNEDVIQYFDRETFEAFKALSPPPNWADPIAWDMAYSERGSELLEKLDDPKTYVYLAGLEPIRDHLDNMFGALMGSKEKWKQKKESLIDQKRWIEVLY